MDIPVLDVFGDYGSVLHYLNLQKGVFFMGLKTVVLNSERMNYDGKLDLSVLSYQV